MNVINGFMSFKYVDRPMLLEVFTDMQDESDALESFLNIMPGNEVSNINETISAVKKTVKDVLGEKRIEGIKMIIKG